MIIERHSVRAILITPEQEVLLFRIHGKDSNEEFWWIKPGGGLEPGESVEDGLRRELYEEVGLRDFSIGPLIWRRQHTFDWGDERICQYEEYFVVHVDRFDPKMTDEVEALSVGESRWWAVTELAHASERLTPLSLAAIVERYLAHGAPKGELEVETLED